MPTIPITAMTESANAGAMLPRVSRRKRRAWVNRGAFMDADVSLQDFGIIADKYEITVCESWFSRLLGRSELLTKRAQAPFPRRVSPGRAHGGAAKPMIPTV